MGHNMSTEQVEEKAEKHAEKIVNGIESKVDVIKNEFKKEHADFNKTLSDMTTDYENFKAQMKNISESHEIAIATTMDSHFDEFMKKLKRMKRESDQFKEQMKNISEGHEEEIASKLNIHIETMNRLLKKELSQMTSECEQIREKMTNISESHETKMSNILESHFEVLTERFQERTGTPESTDLNLFIRKHLLALLSWKILLMFAAVVLIISIKTISDVSDCQLKKALDTINLEYSPSLCKYDAIKEHNLLKGLYACGGISLIFNLVHFVVFIIIRIKPIPDIKELKILMICIIGVFSLFLLIGSLVFQSLVFKDKKDEQAYINFVQLRSSMLKNLQTYYTSDDINSGDEVSRGWNYFFINYDCCAVREVEGTTNDFDNTPWCTTSGSCQSTASQIPRTCCKDVTEDNYQNAPAACHASVNSGTFKQSCISRVEAMSTVNIDDYELFLLFISPLVVGILQVFDFVIQCLPILRGLRFSKGKNTNAVASHDNSNETSRGKAGSGTFTVKASNVKA